MECQDQMLTEKSIELESGSDNGRKGHMLDKMAAHLTFMETEMQRGFDWQRQLIKQARTNFILGQGHISVKQEQFELSVSQQRILSIFFGRYLGPRGEGLNLHELINKIGCLQPQSIAKDRFNPSAAQTDRLQFPVVPRVLTINDLAPSTQVKLTGSPPSLPPKTPKAKKGVGKENKFVTNGKQKQEFQGQSAINNGSNYKFYSEDKGSEQWSKSKDVQLQDSLGKRLFQEQQQKYVLIEDQIQKRELGDSQVSLNLSSSNQDKRADYCCKMAGQQIHKSKFDGNRRESLLLQGIENSEIKEIQGLRFRQNPKRKIGKCVMKRENFFAYEQVVSGKIRKMHDSFGQAYQQYYLGNDYGPKEAFFYRCLDSRSNNLQI